MNEEHPKNIINSLPILGKIAFDLASLAYSSDKVP